MPLTPNGDTSIHIQATNKEEDDYETPISLQQIQQPSPQQDMDIYNAEVPGDCPRFPIMDSLKLKYSPKHSPKMRRNGLVRHGEKNKKRPTISKSTYGSIKSHEKKDNMTEYMTVEPEFITLMDHRAEESEDDEPLYMEIDSNLATEPTSSKQGIDNPALITTRSQLSINRDPLADHTSIQVFHNPLVSTTSMEA